MAWAPGGLTFTPHLLVVRTRWQRNLLKYTEKHTHVDMLLGMRLQHRLNSNLDLEASWAGGRSVDGMIRSAELAVSLPAPQRRLQTEQIGIGMAFGPLWRGSVRLACTQLHAPASAIRNGFQQPAMRSSDCSAGLAAHYYF